MNPDSQPQECLLLIDNYDSFTFNLYQMLQERTSCPVKVFRNNEIRLEDVQKLSPKGIIFSPGPGQPSKKEDFGVCGDILMNHESISANGPCPILGICLGHQGIAYYMGGELIKLPDLYHGKSSTVTQYNSAPIFKGLPESFEVMRYHSWAIDDQKLPRDIEVIAREESTGLIMGVQHQTRRITGLQFHPESIGTPVGGQILENFIVMCGLKPLSSEKEKQAIHANA